MLKEFRICETAPKPLMTITKSCLLYFLIYKNFIFKWKVIFYERLMYSAMLHKSHTYCNLLLVEKRDGKHLDNSVWKLRKASVTLMTGILNKTVSLPQFSGNFVQLHFLLVCQHRQYRITMLPGCNQPYPHLPLIFMGLGVTWLKSHSTESLEECSE